LHGVAADAADWRAEMRRRAVSAESIMRQFHRRVSPPCRDGDGYVLKPGYDFGDEFEFGLGLILDALARLIPDNGASLPEIARSG
jgi:hypothetical protein